MIGKLWIDSDRRLGRSVGIGGLRKSWIVWWVVGGNLGIDTLVRKDVVE